ncbi:MAG: hypothetical protein B6I28_01730 [Fusobacteriia bacterium 4572_132]|nr:MAG: hypothetical protein B6I28_01730 [Fusobacteriia bacterium 4572_132]
MKNIKAYILMIIIFILIGISLFFEMSEYKYEISIFFILILLLVVIEVIISVYRKFYFMKEYKTLYFVISYTILSIIITWVLFITLWNHVFSDYYIYTIKYIEVGIGFLAILLLRKEFKDSKRNHILKNILMVSINFILLLIIIKFEIEYFLLLIFYLEIYYISNKLKGKIIKSFFLKSIIYKIFSEILNLSEKIFQLDSLYIVEDILYIYSMYILVIYFNYVLNRFLKKSLEKKDKEIDKTFQFSSDGMIIAVDNKVEKINKKALKILGLDNLEDLKGKELELVNKNFSILEEMNGEKTEITINIENRKIKCFIFKFRIGLEDKVVILLKELIEEDQILYKFIENNRDIIYIYEKDFGYRYINSSIKNVLGYSKKDFYEKREINRKIEYRKDLSKCLGENRNFIRVVAKNGEVLWLMENLVEMVIEGKEYRCVSATDITELKMKEKELEQQNINLQNINYKKEMEMSIVSHEIRTPITAIIGFVENILLNKNNLDDKMFRYISKIYNNSMRLKELVNNLLDYNKLLAGKLELNREKIDLKKLLNEVLLNNEILTEIKEIEVVNNITESIYIIGDINMMHQILNNLISNGIKYNSKKGKMIFDSEENEKYIILKISDTGLGIKSTDEDKLFKEYERIKGMKEKGTGLGLPLTKKLVEMNKGKIWFSSELGKGTTFYIELPKG